MAHPELVSFTKRVKDDLGMGKIKVAWLTSETRGSALINENTIRIPTPEVLETVGMTREEAFARSKAAIVEELCHLNLKIDHSPQLCTCYNKAVSKFMDDKERGLVAGKTARLNDACAKFTPSEPTVKEANPEQPPTQTMP